MDHKGLRVGLYGPQREEGGQGPGSGSQGLDLRSWRSGSRGPELEMRLEV